MWERSNRANARDKTDNSTGNKNNPNPASTVHYGDQTWDEMMAGYLTYTIDNASSTGCE